MYHPRFGQFDCKNNRLKFWIAIFLQLKEVISFHFVEHWNLSRISSVLILTLHVTTQIIVCNRPRAWPSFGDAVIVMSID